MALLNVVGQTFTLMEFSARQAPDGASAGVFTKQVIFQSVNDKREYFTGRWVEMNSGDFGLAVNCIGVKFKVTRMYTSNDITLQWEDPPAPGLPILVFEDLDREQVDAMDVGIPSVFHVVIYKQYAVEKPKAVGKGGGKDAVAYREWQATAAERTMEVMSAVSPTAFLNQFSDVAGSSHETLRDRHTTRSLRSTYNSEIRDSSAVDPSSSSSRWTDREGRPVFRAHTAPSGDVHMSDATVDGGDRMVAAVNDGDTSEPSPEPSREELVRQERAREQVLRTGRGNIEVARVTMSAMLKAPDVRLLCRYTGIPIATNTTKKRAIDMFLNCPLAPSWGSIVCAFDIERRSGDPCFEQLYSQAACDQYIYSHLDLSGPASHAHAS